MISSLIKRLFRIRFGPWQKVSVKNVYGKRKGVWAKVDAEPRKTWGNNPNCPKCGQRTVMFDIYQRQVYCPRCRDVVYQLYHWPVPADYLKHHGAIVTNAIPPQLRG